MFRSAVALNVGTPLTLTAIMLAVLATVIAAWVLVEIGIRIGRRSAKSQLSYDRARAVQLLHSRCLISRCEAQRLIGL